MISPCVKPRLHCNLILRMSTVQLERQESLSDSDRKLQDQWATILDREIDGLIYEIYGLMEEEIGIAEGAWV